MGWIWIGFALLNTFANCDFYLCFDIYTLSAKACVEQGVNKAYGSILPLLLIPSWALATERSFFDKSASGGFARFARSPPEADLSKKLRSLAP